MHCSLFVTGNAMRTSSGTPALARIDVKLCRKQWNETRTLYGPILVVAFLANDTLLDIRSREDLVENVSITG